MDIRIKSDTNSVACKTIIENNIVCSCQVNFTDNTWTISSWYTTKNHKHQGIGKKTLQAALQKVYDMTSKPDKIEYIWNGANQYVYDWMTHHFDPIYKCPIAVQKYASEDDWDSHIYILNVEKVLQYFEIK